MRNTSHLRPMRVERLEDRCTPAVVPSGFNVSTIASGFQSAIAMTFGPGGEIYVAEQGGQVRIIRDGQLRPEPIGSVAVGEAGFFGERGLLGLTLDPNFSTNGYLYLMYSPPSATPINRLSRFTVVGDTIDMASETILFEMPGADGHNGGALAFGADGKLYIATGDLRTPQYAQALDNLHGKILRINPDGSIPVDNPYYFAVDGSLRAIWAVGLRNPFTFSFQPGTNRLFINDVGELTWEEVNEGVPGANFGWPLHEGPTDLPGFNSPVHAYLHPNAPSEGAAITAGVFYNPTVANFPPEFTNSYFFIDFLAGQLQRIDLNNGNTITPFGSEMLAVVDMDIGPDGGLYFLDRDRAVIQRILYQPQSPPSIETEPTDVLASTGEAVRFSVGVTNAAGVQAQWFRNGRAIPGATGLQYDMTKVSLKDHRAKYHVELTNEFGTTRSREVTLSVLNNRRPSATIQVDVNPAGWAAGETINYRANATDREDGTLPGSAYTWSVEYHTGDATRPYVLPTSGSVNGSFTTQLFTPFKSTAVFFRIQLTITDSTGLTFSTFRDVFPRTSLLTIESDLPNAVRLDGQPITTPTTISGVVGLMRSLEAQPIIIANNATYRLVEWVNSTTPLTEFAFPANPTTYRARYELVPERSEIIPPGTINPALPTVPAAPELASGTSRFITASGPGEVGYVRVFDSRGELLTLRPFESDFLGGLRVHSADITGDRIEDVLVVPGAGGGPILQLYDGAFGGLIHTQLIFEATFRGGLFVTGADLNGDGIAEMVLSPDEGGGPRVQILDGVTRAVIVDFLAIDDVNFRGGVRTALGHLNGDNIPDLIVSAGNGGGPRISIYDGQSLLNGSPVPLMGDFFVFEPELRGGSVPAVGDINGDGFTDLIFGAGPGGAPRVLGLDGRSFIGSQGAERRTIANFFYTDIAFTGGVNLSVRDLDGDERADMLLGIGSGAPPIVTLIDSDDIDEQGKPESLRQFFAFEPTLRHGVYVG